MNDRDKTIDQLCRKYKSTREEYEYFVETGEEEGWELCSKPSQILDYMEDVAEGAGKEGAAMRRDMLKIRLAIGDLKPISEEDVQYMVDLGGCCKSDFPKLNGQRYEYKHRDLEMELAEND